MEYRISLNNIFLNDLPHGIEDLEVTIERSIETGGKVLEFTTNLIFWGDGYNYLLAQANCDEVIVRIYKNSGSDTYNEIINGTIVIGSPEYIVMCDKCQIETPVENADLSYLIQNADIRINTIYDLGRDGTTAITPVTAIDVTPYSGLATRKAFRLEEVIEHGLAYLSNNTITLNSPVLSTEYIPEQWRIQLNTLPNTADVLTVVWRNPFGRLLTFQYTWQALSLIANVATLANFFLRQVPDVDSFGEARAYNCFESASYAYPLTIGANEYLEVRNLLPFEIVSIVSSGAGTFTITQAQAYQFGLRDVTITSALLLGADVPAIFRIARGEEMFNYNLKELLKMVTDKWNLQFRLVRTGVSTYRFDLLPTEDYFTNLKALSINNNQVLSIKKKYSSEFMINQLDISGEANNCPYLTQTWIGCGCFGESKNIDFKNFVPDGYFPVYSDLGVANQDVQDIYWIEDNLRVFNFRETTAGFPVNQTVTGYIFANMITVYRYSINSACGWRQPATAFGAGFNAINTSTCSDGCNEKTITNDINLYFTGEKEIEAVLTCEQYMDIINQTTEFIEVEDCGILVNLWVVKAEIAIKTGKVTITGVYGNF